MASFNPASGSIILSPPYLVSKQGLGTKQSRFGKSCKNPKRILKVAARKHINGCWVSYNKLSILVLDAVLALYALLRKMQREMHCFVLFCWRYQLNTEIEWA